MKLIFMYIIRAKFVTVRHIDNILQCVDKIIQFITDKYRMITLGAKKKIYTTAK